MLLARLWQGRWKLYGVCNGRGDCEISDFLAVEPDDRDRIAGDKRRMTQLLVWVSQSPAGPPRNDEVSHQLDGENGIWEFIKGRIRVLWFYDGDRMIILSHGFIKATRKTPAQQLEKARKAVREYHRDRQADKIQIIAEEER